MTTQTIPWYKQYQVNIPEGESGNWEVKKFTVKEDDARRWRYSFQGRDVPPDTYTKLQTKNSWHDPVMSDTPAEINDHISFIMKAHGRCLINGLGIGMVLKAIAAKDEVTHIDVVELEQDVINLVWPSYANNPKITLHHADAYEIEWPKGTKWDCIWHDIWPTICIDNLEGITKLKKKYMHKTIWQAAWLEEELRAEKRRNRYCY